MRKMKVPLLIFCFIVAFTFKSYAQVSVGLQGGAARSTKSDLDMLGFGVNLRIHATPHLAIGAAAKVYAGSNEYGSGSSQYKLINGIIPVTGTVDYYFSTGVVRPYIGGDAGVYISNYAIEQNDDRIYESSNYKNFGAAPRAGIIFALGNIGLQVEGIYHCIFNNKNHQATTGNLGNVNFKSSSQALGVNVGLIIGLNRKK